MKRISIGKSDLQIYPFGLGTNTFNDLSAPDQFFEVLAEEEINLEMISTSPIKISCVIADYIGGLGTLLLGSALQCLALLFYIPFDGLVSLYVVSAIFGLSQGGIVPSYALIVREYFPAREAGSRVGVVLMATIVGMALGGWLSGVIYDWTGSYQVAFWNGIACGPATMKAPPALRPIC